MSEILLLAMETWNGMSIEHMEILNSYVHEKFMYGKYLYVEEPMNAGGHNFHGGTIGLLKKPVYW